MDMGVGECISRTCQRPGIYEGDLRLLAVGDMEPEVATSYSQAGPAVES